MSGQSELQAIIANQIARLQALHDRIPALPVWDMEAQRDSGLEINRIFAEQVEINVDGEIHTMDLLRSYGGQDPLTDRERRDYRLGRLDDYSDLTSAALEEMQTAVLEAAE